MNYKQLLSKIETHVTKQFDLSENPGLLYHNLRHTKDVVSAATEIANHYRLNKEEYFIVLIAAWFHDIGYLKSPANHEEHGAKLAEEYLTKHKVSIEDITVVKACILATKIPQSAVTLPEKILCDADLYHLGTARFYTYDKTLFKEYNAIYSPAIDKPEWLNRSLQFLEAHTYYTDYCQQALNGTQLQNIELLKKKITMQENNREDQTDEIFQEPEQTFGKQGKKNSDNIPDKGIETMFRVSSSNHQRLSDMADKKAHIMITVNSIILSAIISLVLRRLDDYGFLIAPSFILLTVSLTAMIFSILSTRPSVPAGVFTKEDIESKNVNLLFFGNFYKMKLEDFNYGMQKMMKDGEFLYGSLIRDVYHQGIVLGKKYYLLRISYNVFMFGLIISVLAFIITFTFFNHHAIKQ